MKLGKKKLEFPKEIKKKDTLIYMDGIVTRS